MNWLTMVVVAWLGFASVAGASLTPRKPRLDDKERAQALSGRLTSLVARQVALSAGAEPEFNVTEQTEILLDGRPCSYQDVPANASILKIEVGADKKTALKIHFRRRK